MKERKHIEIDDDDDDDDDDFIFSILFKRYIDNYDIDNDEDGEKMEEEDGEDGW